jgi:hypothetical protein
MLRSWRSSQIFATQPFSAMIPSSQVFDQSTMTQLLAHDPVVGDYRALFSLFDWSLVQQWQEQRSVRGRPAHPESAYLKAFLVRINEGSAPPVNCGTFSANIPCWSSN